MHYAISISKAMGHFHDGPDYLRCANIGIWDAHSGYNTLVDGVTVSHKLSQ